MNNIETLSRSEIRDYAGQHMYVLNVSDHAGTRPRQELLMTFIINGNDRTIEIPNTWIPIDLTARVSISQIKDNSDFWLFIQRKDLVVISREVAESELEEEDAVEEYNRIFGIDDSKERYSIKINKSGGISKKKEKPAVGSMRVISIIKKDVPENQKIAALKNIKADLKEDDYKYILNESKIGDNEKLKAFALNELKMF